MTKPSVRARRELVARKGDASGGERVVPAEVPVAFTYDHATYAVMMASPSDFEDFAIGFSLNERIVRRVDEIAELEAVEMPRGYELRMSLATARAGELESRRRRIAGPAGCGLCGIESLDAAVRPPPLVTNTLTVSPQTIFTALKTLAANQPLNSETRAVHAAGFWSLTASGFAAVREDVGRHNALDKLAGALARARIDAANGFIVMTSRISIELVQKTCAMGAPLLVAVSAPTTFALEAAEAANLTLIAVARDDSFEIFTHPERIAAAVHVA
ncbi:MAG TPA: formate dehydrogenase accessory sulfurtransferase FdhD [Rhizomicrobium sp.]|jgi:FdhD protein